MIFRKTALACILATTSFGALAKNEPVSFETLALKNTKLPAIQIYLAEQASYSEEYNLAAEKYVSAIELGMSNAVWNLMKMIDEDKLTGEELELSLKNIKSMARDDNQLTLFLADYYHNRDGSQKHAFHWLNNAMKLGEDGVSEILADYIIEELGGANEHYTSAEAATLLRKASESGSGSAAIKLAKIFDESIFVSRNLGQARHYYTLAAERGEIEANFRLAYFMEHGIGGAPDLEKAAQLYTQLIQSDLAPEVHYRLSRLYMYNDKVFGDSKVDGIAHLMRSAELGDSDALYKVGVSTYYGSDGFKVNVNKAIEYLSEAAYSGNKLAAQRLVQLYKNGDRTIKPNNVLMREFQKILTEPPKIK